MANTAWQSFIDRIAWEGDVHIDCDILAAPLEPARLARLEELDAGILATLGMLGERRGEPPEDEATAAALAQMDAKLDVLLEMFNRHLLGHLRMPPRRKVRFNVLGLRMDGPPPAAPGDAVLVRLYFDACVGLPLELPGRVAQAPRASGGFVAFDPLSEGIRDGIEHLVFRQHRRQVAEARANRD